MSAFSLSKDQGRRKSGQRIAAHQQFSFANVHDLAGLHPARACRPIATCFGVFVDADERTIWRMFATVGQLRK
jgi:hypothetical protein